MRPAIEAEQPPGVDAVTISNRLRAIHRDDRNDDHDDDHDHDNAQESSLAEPQRKEVGPDTVLGTDSMDDVVEPEINATRNPLGEDAQATFVASQDALDEDEKADLMAVLAARRTASRRAHTRCTAVGVVARRRNYRGSVRGRRANKTWDFDMGLHNIVRDYFGLEGAPPVYDEADFERRFRVPRTVFLHVYHAIKNKVGFKQTINATGRRQAHPLQKVVAAFFFIAYGETFDRADEYVRLSRSTVALCTKRLLEFVVKRFSGDYLRQPTDAEVASILARNKQRGLPGCIVSIDCTHWRWTACPKGFHGLYHSHKKSRSVVTLHTAAPFGGVQRRACSGDALLHTDSKTTDRGATTNMRQPPSRQPPFRRRLQQTGAAATAGHRRRGEPTARHGAQWTGRACRFRARLRGRVPAT